MDIGIIGAGAIARYIMNETKQNKAHHLRVKSIYVRDVEKYRHIEKQYNVKLYSNIDEFLHSGIDIVVEAANIQAVNELLPKVLQEKDVVLISIGALADETFLKQVNVWTEKYMRELHLPSGAIGGLDLIQNVKAVGKVESVSLTTRKPAHTLVDKVLDGEQIVFDGVAADAIKLFPKNINVSIILSLAGIGMKKTKVKIIADPHVDKNIHTIEADGEFGSTTFTITNNPLPENPNTSYLAAISIIGTLSRIGKRVKIS